MVDCDRELFTWAFSTLLSRLVKLPGSSGVDTCVPWADMLNHSPHVSAFFEYDPASRSVVLRPDRSYRAGEQVCCMPHSDERQQWHCASQESVVWGALYVRLGPGSQ